MSRNDATVLLLESWNNCNAFKQMAVARRTIVQNNFAVLINLNANVVPFAQQRFVYHLRRGPARLPEDVSNITISLSRGAASYWKPF